MIYEALTTQIIFEFKIPIRIFRSSLKTTDIIEEEANTANEYIYQNPARDYIEINFDSINPTLKRGVDEVADIQIFDMLGVNVSTPSAKAATP